MLKRICCAALIAALVLICAASSLAEAPVAYDVILSSENPVPDICDRVRPAVVQVNCSVEIWDSVTRVSSTEESGSGSGCYILEDPSGTGGYILTNNHVIQDAEVLEIEWISGEVMEAELVGKDDGTDIAVLHFSDKAPEGVSVIPMGDSDALRIGELAICIGNPGTSTEVLRGSVSAGIISGLARDDINADNFTRNVSVIQTDAAINTGNSGGALLNSKGELVGIPTLKFMQTPTIVYEGLGFCIPINFVRDFIDQIIQTGGVVRPRLGITVGNIDGPDEPMKKYPPIGAQVFTVEEKSPSAVAGLQVGDVITEINGIRIKDYFALLKELDNCKTGDEVELKVYRYYDENNELTGTYEELFFKVKLEILD